MSLNKLFLKQIVAWTRFLTELYKETLMEEIPEPCVATGILGWEVQNSSPTGVLK